MEIDWIRIINIILVYLLGYVSGRYSNRECGYNTSNQTITEKEP